MNKILLAVAMSVILFVVTSSPKIFIGTENHTIAVINSRENLPVTIEFVHSVQKTPVIEELFTDSSGEFVLKRTIYQSQGVGLPFDASDGNFRRENDKFIFDDMNRRIKTLELRSGKDSRLKITIDGKTFELYKDFPLGTKFIVKTF